MRNRRLAAIMIALRKRGLLSQSVKNLTSIRLQGDDFLPNFATYGRKSVVNSTGHRDLSRLSRKEKKLAEKHFVTAYWPKPIKEIWDRTTFYPTKMNKGLTSFEVHGPESEVLYGKPTKRYLGPAIVTKPPLWRNKNKSAEDVVREFQYGVKKSGLDARLKKTHDRYNNATYDAIRNAVKKDITTRRRRVIAKAGGIATVGVGSGLAIKKYKKKKST